jgi:hypothetical protein
VTIMRLTVGTINYAFVDELKSDIKYLTFLTLNNTVYGSNFSILIKSKLVTSSIIMQKNTNKILALLTVYMAHFKHNCLIQ